MNKTMNIKAPEIESVTLILSYRIQGVNIPRRLSLDALTSFFSKRDKSSDFDNVRDVLSYVKSAGTLEKYDVNGYTVTFWFTFTKNHAAHKLFKEAKGYISVSIALELSYSTVQRLSYPSTDQTANIYKLKSYCLENSEEPYVSLSNLVDYAISCKAFLLSFRVKNAYKKVFMRFKFEIADANKFVSAFY